MNRLWRVAFHEYSRHVFRKRFLLGLLSVPFFIALLVGLVVVIVLMEIDTTPIGYVDQAGWLTHPVQAPQAATSSATAPILAFESEEAATAALEAGDIQAIYVFEPDYLKTSRARLIFIKEPKEFARDSFYEFLQANLLASQPPDIANRLIEGSEMTVRSADGSREINASQWFNIMIPLFGGILFLAAIFSGSGYLMQAMAEEKENRTIEIVITSLSPGQLMAGKIIGNLAIGFTQMAAWLGFAAAALSIGGNYAEVIRQIKIETSFLLLTLAVMIPSFAFFGAIMAAIGATVSDVQEGQQIVGLVSMPVWIPYWLLVAILPNPNGPLAVILTFIPITAPTMMSLRAGFAVVPTWQIVVCVSILILSAAAAIWFAGRAFRLGLLRYGKRITLREIFQRQPLQAGER